MNSAQAPLERERPDSRRALTLFLLVLVYTFNFIDRQIVGILAVPIKADLGLSDTQLGLMGGLAFALFYTGLGIPVAILADRFSRTWIMTGALVIWSAMTAACGLAHNFWQLFLARLGVGVGEAGGVAPAYSLISDMFPPGQRARALSIYSFGIPIGSALGIVFGGVIASMIDWRFAFFAVGIAGVILAPIFRLTVREPERGRFDTQQEKRPPPAPSAIVRALVGKPSFWLISLGASCSSMMGYGLFFWLPSFFVRSHGLTLLDASLFYGAALLIGGLAGIWAGGWLGDRFGQAKRARYVTIPARIPAVDPLLPGHGAFAEPGAYVFRDAGPYRPGARVARPRDFHHPAPGAAGHARHGLRGVPVHQQPDWDWHWNLGDRRAFRPSGNALRRRFAALLDSRRHVLLRAGGQPVLPGLPMARQRLGGVTTYSKTQCFA